MKNKIITFMLVFLFVLLIVPIINADESFIFKQNTNSTLEVPIFENDLSKCSTCSCEISIDYPNGSNMVRSVSTTITGHYAIYTLSKAQNSVIGIYKGDLHCTNGADNGGATFEYEITTTGGKVSLSNIIIVIVFLLLSGICMVLGYSFNKEHWLLKTFFYFCAVLLGIIAINSARIISSESEALSNMGTMGLLIFIVIFAIFLIYMFVFAFIEIIKVFREKGNIRWSYDD